MRTASSIPLEKKILGQHSIASLWHWEVEVSRKETTDYQPLPSLIAHLVESAKAAGESKYATVLAQFGHLAVAHVQSHEILTLPGAVRLDDERHKRLKEIATQHLGLADLERRFQTVLDGSTPRAAGNSVVTTLNEMLVVRDTAHILWGLSLGLALAEHAARVRR
jgi:hypothetical protein